MNETKILKVATVNDVAILMTEENLVPIKPICEALGIDFASQFTKLKEDDFLSSTVVLSTMVGGDGKEREMVCLPQEFIFGWLFTINPKNVKEEAKEAVAKYRMECYRALFNYFTEPIRFMSEQTKAANALIDKYQKARIDFRDAKAIMDDYYTRFNKVRKLTIEEWRINNSILELDFEAVSKIEE